MKDQAYNFDRIFSRFAARANAAPTATIAGVNVTALLSAEGAGTVSRQGDLNT